MEWLVSIAPTIEPVTLAEAKLHLKVDNEADNALIESLIKTARAWCEGYQNRSYITRTITLKADKFANVFYLPRPLLLTVTSIKYVDPDGNQQTVSTDVYEVDIYSQPGRVGLKYNQSWPAMRSGINAVEVIYTAGYGPAAADVPDGVKAAIKLLVGHLYMHRSAVCDGGIEEVPLAVRSILAMDKTF